MNRSKNSPASRLFVEALEPRIAPAALLNESKFTSVTVGGTVLLDASDPNGFQGITTGTGGGSGSYLLYITAGKALVYTSDLNGDHILESNEITGISAGVDSNGKSLDLIAFTSIHGDIITNLQPGRGVSAITDSDNNPSNGLDGRVLLNNGIHSITLRTLNAGDINTGIPGNTVLNRLALTTFSIYGNIYTGGDFGGPGAGLTVDTSGSGLLAQKFAGFNSNQYYNVGDHPYIEGIYTGTAASNQHFNLTYGVGTNVQGSIAPFMPLAGAHGGDITGVKGASSATLFDIDELATGAGGTGARGGNIAEVALHGDRGGYQILTGDGGSGASGGNGGALIMFNDLGTVTSQVIIHTGAGGTGSLGMGGAGGAATFATSALAANVQLYLGRGGDGFSGGGSGDGLTNATFAVPEGAIPVGGLVLGTYHEIGDIGNTQYLGNGLYAPRVIDFDGDGNGDTLYTTTTPDQIVLMFGDGNGSFSDSTGNLFGSKAKTIYLDAPGVVLNTVIVADVNGDGRPDVIAASNSPDAGGGIYVFLNQIGDNLHNPIGGSLYSRNPLGDHPFSSPLITPIPSLFNQGFFDSTNPILALTAGDFNHDGIMDVAYVADYRQIGTGTPPSVFSVLGVVFGHAATNAAGNPIINTLPGGQPRAAGTGYFYANSNPDTTGLPVLQYAVEKINNANSYSYVIQASAEAATAATAQNPFAMPAHADVIFLALQGEKSLQVYQANTDPFFGGLLQVSTIALGMVDTNRGPDTSLASATALDFAILDSNHDGFADLAVLTKSPGDFLVTLVATPSSSGVGNTYFITSGDAVNNAGFVIDDDGGTGTTITNIRPIDYDGDGIFNEVAVLDFGSESLTVPHIQQVLLPVPPATAAGFVAGTVPLGRFFIDSLYQVKDQTVHGFDAYYQYTLASAPIGVGGAQDGIPQLTPGYGLLSANMSEYSAAFFEVAIPIGTDPTTTMFSLLNNRYETDNGIRIVAGGGGNSTAGVGGAGGSLGNTLTSGLGGIATGSIQIIFPAYAAYFGEAALVGGNGGSGFGGGGAGGDVKGVSTRYSQDATVLDSIARLLGGNGGNGVIGDGGSGGSLAQFSLASGQDLLAGNAGNGVHGGNGGNIVGNGTNGILPDLEASSYVTVIAGQGGLGSLQGGVGGRIDTFRPLLISGGPLTYISGTGGSAAGGTGGDGGAIANSSPDPNQNDLSQGITLITGNGGNGLTGGVGGAINNFVNQTTSSTGIPITRAITTGTGGIGISGDGGNGGAITGIIANASGLGTAFFDYSTSLVRVLAGNGGASYGGQGGNGGSISNSSVQAVSSPIVIAAGVGGNGLTVGGTGGSIINNTFNSSALNIGKMLVIAGAGGDASGAAATDIVIPGDNNTNDLAHAVLALGGVSGIGGDGGSIIRLTQPTSTQTSVDLIAGNGGSTLNYGSALSTVTNVGKGGSVDTINITGTIGAAQRDVNLQYNPPIKSYLDASNTGTESGTLSDFVAVNFTGTVDTRQLPGERVFQPNNFFALNNAAGNVGIVAGTAGKTRGGQPASDGVTGSVQNITASSIMSIVAGSVDRVAPVQLLSNIVASNIGGVLGADKSLNPTTGPLFGGPDGKIQYYDQNGNIVSNLQAGYRLLDGALFAINIQQPSSGPLLRGPRIFSPAG